MARFLTLVEAQAAGHITHIRGTDSNIGMTIDVQNGSDERITITSEPGTVIGSRDQSTQRMVITRNGSWIVPPRSKGRIRVDALCMEAHKAPPRSSVGVSNHSIDGMTDNTDVRKLLGTLQDVEARISTNITYIDPETGTFRHKLRSPNLVKLAAAASHTPKSTASGAAQSRVVDSVVQMPVWQLTDRLQMDEYAKIISLDSPATQQELRQAAEVLTQTAKLAEILLREAGLSSKQTIHPPDDELEVLYLEHDLLSQGISKLRKEALRLGADEKSIQIKLDKRLALLTETEREIKIEPYKNDLIESLSRLPISNTHAGRTALLDGMRTDSLERDEGMKRLDLNLIITQLARLGRDDQDKVLLIRLIDNALPYAEGFEPHSRLVVLKNRLETI